MKNKWINEEYEKELKERFLLVSSRIRQIAAEGAPGLPEHFADYFTRTANFLSSCTDRYEEISSGAFFRKSLEEVSRENGDFYRDILPQNYEQSYASPAYAVRVLGEEFGRILSFLYTELRGLRSYIFQEDLERTTILYELFLEIYGIFEQDIPAYKKVRDVIYWFYHDYADVWAGCRVRQLLDPDLTFARDIIMGADLCDLRYLYSYGDYISKDEIGTADHLNSLPLLKIQEIASTFTEGYCRGFANKNVDLAKKTSVNIRFPIGFERVIREAVQQFELLGLKVIFYPEARSVFNRKRNARIGYISTNPNPQYMYDHRFDSAVYLDKRMIDRKLTCMRKAYEKYEDQARGFAGPACLEAFGQEPFEPVNTPEAYRLSERQEDLAIQYTGLANSLMNEFINQEERSFTIIAYPLPSIGEPYPEIFDQIHQINIQDNDLYQAIQQRMIDVLDSAVSVKLMGRGKNMTNLTVSLQDLTDPASQTKFENCLADVNIPVGEVFTTPKLTGTSGLFHVTEVFLSGICYKDLRLTFEDGIVTDYSCTNFKDPEMGRKFIKNNLFFGRESLPMGEFAIGTNTTAYAAASRYDIMRKLPILIAEKMGPHIAVGDSCYAYSEDMKVFNPDGKEIIARENDFSLKRDTEPKKAYFNCHTDITIPYEELDRVVAVTADRVTVPIILDGRFCLEGTFDLNKPFQHE